MLGKIWNCSGSYGCCFSFYIFVEICVLMFKILKCCLYLCDCINSSLQSICFWSCFDLCFALLIIMYILVLFSYFYFREYVRHTNSVAYFLLNWTAPFRNYIQGCFSAKIGSCSYSVAESVFMLAFCVYLAVGTGLEDNPCPLEINQVLYLLKCTTKHLKKVLSAPSSGGVLLFDVCPHWLWGSKVMWFFSKAAEISLAPYPQAYPCPTQIKLKYSEKRGFFLSE